MLISTAVVMSVAMITSQITPILQPSIATPSLETSSTVQPGTIATMSIQTAAPAYPPASTDDFLQEELRKRQNTGQVNGALAAATVVTQQSPVTTYMMYGSAGETPVAYTQLFSAVPDQWEGPTIGSIGLGTITGQVGVVKTKVKRDLVAAATDAVKKFERRAKPKSAGSASTNNAGVVTAPKLMSTATVSAFVIWCVLAFPAV